MNGKVKVERNHFLDVLKGIAILFIIVTHYQWSNEERLLMGFPYWIDMAVTIFMVISGYLYAKSFENKGIDSFEKAYELKSILEKILRFTIPFAVAFMIEVVYIEMLMPDAYNLGILFLQGGLGAGSYYYPIMIQFIFLFPVIFFIVRKYLLKGLFICLGMNIAYETLHWAYGMNEGCYRLIVLRYIFVIAFGVFLSYKERCDDRTKKLYKKILIVMFIIGVFFIYLVCYTDYQPRIIVHWTRVSFMGSMYFVPILDWLISKCRINCKPLELLGKVSFNIFLTQMVFYWVGASIIYSYVSSRKLQLLLCTIICVSVGVLFYWIEQPITKWLIKKIRK